MLEREREGGGEGGKRGVERGWGIVVRRRGDEGRGRDSGRTINPPSPPFNHSYLPPQAPPYHVALTRQLIQGRDGGDPICATIMQDLKRLLCRLDFRARVRLCVCVYTRVVAGGERHRTSVQG